MREPGFSIVVTALAALTLFYSVAFADQGDTLTDTVLKEDLRWVQYPSPCMDPNKPIDIKSKRHSIKNTRDGKRAIFEGQVEMKHGEITLTCDHLVIDFGDITGARKSIAASGYVVIYQNEQTTVARKVVYDCMKGTVTIEK